MRRYPPVGVDSGAERSIRAARLEVLRAFDVQIEVEIEGGVGIESEAEAIDQIAQIGGLAPRLAVVLERLIEPIGQPPFLKLPFGAEIVVRADLIGNLACAVEAGVDRKRAAELTRPVQVVSQPRQPD